MNCEALISQLGFRCRSLGDDTLRIWSPFTYTGDGEHIGFYVEKTKSGYRVSDNCEALMHATSLGINLTQHRMDSIRRAAGDEGCLSDAGEIAVFASESGIAKAMSTVMSAALAVSHFQSQWAPRFKADSFPRAVEEVLESVVGVSQLQRKVSVTGASGHQLELPLAVQWSNGITYVQPISASDDGSVDWRRVYESYGRMSDLKNARISGADRLVVLEESANDSEMGNAIAVLTDSSPVVIYSKLRQWAQKRFA